MVQHLYFNLLLHSAVSELGCAGDGTLRATERGNYARQWRYGIMVVEVLWGRTRWLRAYPMPNHEAL